MNNGVIAKRYATAFFELVREHPEPEQTYNQVRTLLSLMGRLPQLRQVLLNSRYASLEERISLMRTALAPAALSADIVNLFTLMHKNSRDDLFRLVLLDFLALYRESKGLVMVMVTTANGNHDLDGYISHLTKEYFGGTADIVTKSDPDMIGGFVIDSWGYRLDASVRTQLETLRKELTAITKRSV